ncbi:MAG: hypothetical protein ACXABY_27105 [Candidatus Thorarchaeota archaeon]|jgi:hypothetical protein
MRDAFDIETYLEYLLHDSQAAMWDASKKMAAINASYDQINNRIMEAHENWFYTEATLSAGTAAWERTPFDMPAPKTIAKILLLTDTEGRPIEPINLAARDYTYPIVANRNLQTGYWIGHDKLYLNADSWTADLRLYYIRRPPTLITGTAAAGADTTLTMAATPPPVPVDDYYNGVTMWLRGGTGNGESASITDFVGSTRVATVDFATTPSTDSVYATESELPYGHNEIVAMGAAIRALMFDVAQENKLNQFKDWYKKLEFDLMDYVENRQLQVARSVHIRNYD